MMKNFLAYELAIRLYEQCQTLKVKRHLRDQLDRASLSVVLNLAEGAGKPTQPEKRRFYGIAMGSLRETQAILRIVGNQALGQDADRIGGMVYRLVHPKGP